MEEEVLLDAEEKMQEVVEQAAREFASIRTGRASPSLVERLNVDYYGTSTPLNQLATITAPEPRLIVIQPWDKNSLQEIEKAILKSDIGLTPNNDGSVIRITIPKLTEERRKELVKLVAKEAEAKRVAVRAVRREANDALKAAEKESQISEDDRRRAQDDVQELTDTYIEKIEELLRKKEEEIMEV